MKNAIANAGFESSPLANWTRITSGSGNAVSVSTDARTGAFAARFDRGAIGHALLRCTPFSAGKKQRRRASFWAKSLNQPAFMDFELRNEDTGNALRGDLVRGVFVHSSGTWGEAVPLSMQRMIDTDWTEVVFEYVTEGGHPLLAWTIGKGLNTGGSVIVDDCFDGVNK